MTKYKEYLRAHGIPLECDYEVVPCDNVESVSTRVIGNGVVATTYINATESWSAMCNRHGECIVFKSYDDIANLNS